MNRICRITVILALLIAPLAQANSEIPVGKLPRNVIPEKVAIELKIDPALKDFSGTVVMSVNVKEATNTIWMHGRDLKNIQATIQSKNGKPQTLTASQEHVSGVLKLKSKNKIAAGPASIKISYSAAFGQLQGAYKVKPDGSDYVVTQMEALGARNTFPSFDEPSFKHPWDLRLVIPNAQTGIANTTQTSETDAGDGWKKLTFATTENLPSYLLAFAVGPWDVVEAADLPPTELRSTPLKLRGIAAKGQGHRLKYALDNTRVIVEMQEAYFGVAYPFDKLDILAAPDFWAGAMENAGLIVYRDTLLFADEKSPVRQRQAYWGTHAHELAHQWFGNYVTMPWWDDLWLNEAFATWFANKTMTALKPEFHAERSRVESALGPMDSDSMVNTRRVREAINDFTEIQSAFDGITYSKGGAVLAMFERYVGADNFRDAVRSYMKKHARGNATSSDLINAVAARSKEPDAVRAGFNSFIDQAGVPLLSITSECKAEQTVLSIEQSRYQLLGSNASTAGQWGIPVCLKFSIGGNPQEQCQIVSERKSEIALQQKGCADWIMPNADGAGYYRFSLASADQAKLESNFAQLNEREQRVFADSINATFNAGKMDTAAYFSAAQKLSSAPIRQTATALIGEMEWMIRNLAKDEAQKQKIRDFIGKLYTPRLAKLGMQSKTNETDDDGLFRNQLVSTLAFTAKDKTVRATLSAQGKKILGVGGDGKLNMEAAPNDQRGSSIAIYAEDGDAELFETLLAHLKQTQDATDRSYLLGAISSMKNPSIANRARDLALQDGLLRRNELGFVMSSGDDTEENRAAIRAWVDKNFDAMAEKIAPGGASLVRRYSGGMCSEKDAAHIEEKFTQRVASMEGGPRAIKQNVEGIRLCAALKTKLSASGLRIP